jgi:hypothetical protein
MCIGCEFVPVPTYVVRSQNILIGIDGFDETCKSSSYVRKVGNTASNDEYLSSGIFLAGHQINQGLGIFECVFHAWRAGILSIVCQLIRKAQIRNGIGV